MVQTTPNLELFDQKKKNKNKKQKQTKKTRFYNYFWQTVDAILEDVSVAKSIA